MSPQETKEYAEYSKGEFLAHFKNSQCGTEIFFVAKFQNTVFKLNSTVLTSEELIV